MKKLFLTLCLILLPLNFAYAESVKQENISWYRLHFGLGSSQKVASNPEFKNFFSTELTKVFKDGVTISDAKGVWPSPKGMIQENTIVVDAYTPDSPELEQAIQELAKKYNTTFKDGASAVFVVKLNGASSTLHFE